MNLQSLSVRKLVIFVCSGVLLTAIAILLVLYRISDDYWIIICALVMGAAFFAWGVIFLKYFQKKLSLFTDTLCQTLDSMMDGNELPLTAMDAETQLARISHRLERLYKIMRESRLKVGEEKAELQSLVSDISHQTKTPIANLKMLNDTLLTRHLSEDKRKELLLTVGSQVDKLDFLIQAMVKTSRLETGVITLEKKELPISEALAAAISGILPSMERKQITLSVDCPEDLTVAHDIHWTCEALFNLLDNAVKYTPAGGNISLAVQAWEMYLKIDVADTGRGIPESAQGTIFKRFYREPSVHDVEGIGIGLYLTREIITMQGGYIKVASEVGKGSVFSVFLPR